MSSKDQELMIKICGKVENSLKSAMSDTQSSMEKLGSVAKTVAGVAATAFAAIKVGDFISDAVDEYAEFEQSMANTAAIAGASSSEYETLQAAAREAGKATTFTASEAADALGYMALAGWDVATSTEALTPVLQLAEATQADLATTSDQVTDSMSAMGVGIEDLNKYLDVVVATNNNANTTASDLMDAFIGCGGAAQAAGLDFTDTATALGVLANNGIKGSEAGTALNSMLVRISTKDVAQKAFKDLGVAVYDTSGNMRDLQDILIDTSDALSGMTEEEQNSYMSAIAGTNYYSDFKYLLEGVKEGVDGSASSWDSLTESLENSDGALEEMDSTVTSTLQGSLARMQSAISDLKITIAQDFGEPAAEVLDGVAQRLPDITEKFGEMINSLPIDDWTDAMGTMVDGVFDFGERVLEGQSAVEALTGVLSDDFGVTLPDSVQSLIDIFQNAYDLGAEIIGWVTDTALGVIDGVKEALAEHEPQIQSVMDLISDLQTRFEEAFEIASDVVGDLAETDIPELVGTLTEVLGGAADVLDKFVEWEGFIPTVTTLSTAIAGFKLAKMATEIGKVTKAMTLLTAAKIKDKAETVYLNALEAKDAVLKAAATAKTIAQTVATKAAAIAQGALNAVLNANPIALLVIAIAALVAGLVVAYKKCETFRNVVNKAFEGIKTVAGIVLAAVGGFFKAAWSVIKDTWNSFVPYFVRIWNSLKTIFSVVAVILGAVFKEAWTIIKAVWEAVVPFFQNVWIMIKAVFSVVASVLGGFFKSAWAIIKGVWSIVSSYFTLVWEDIKAIFSVVASVLGGFFSAAWEIIKAVWDVVVAFFQAIWNGIASIFEVVASVLTLDFSSAWEGIVGIFSGFIAFFQTLWNSVVSIFGAVAGFFTGVFSAAWTGIKTIFGNVVTFFKGVWDSIVGVFTTIGASIADAISGAVKGAINTVISGAAGIINGFISAINLAIGVINEIPGVNLSKLKSLDVPQLATGGIASNPTLAIIGEGKEQEAVVPLDTMWNKMESIMTEYQDNGMSNAISVLSKQMDDYQSGQSLSSFDDLLDRMQPQSTGTTEENDNSMNITYAPVFNVTGTNLTQNDITEAEKMSQSEFNTMMERWQREYNRKKF